MTPKSMQKFIGILFLMLLVSACNSDHNDLSDSYFEAEIVDFDLNCSTCILKFPNDLSTLRLSMGSSTHDYYQTTNLPKGTFTLHQRLYVRIRKAEDADIRPCITLYPSYDYQKIYILDFKAAA